MKFHKILSSSFCASAPTKFRLHTPHRQTDGQTFSKNSEIVFRTPQNV
ncbi:unnamed protein product [Larinioides sclopetarius]|uniref:Uncharacterized protein n=1 Tax=Larinioides sclopetarius TaxID=280406 RepID=A0AAV2A9N2_9ARAC